MVSRVFWLVVIAVQLIGCCQVDSSVFSVVARVLQCGF